MCCVFFVYRYLQFYEDLKLKNKISVCAKITMPRKKKSIGVGANVKVLLRFIHPSAEIRAKYTNPSKGERLCDCLVIKKGKKVVNRKEQDVIFFCHDDFPNIDLYAVNRYISIVEEGWSTDYFNGEDTDEAVEGEENNKGPEIEETHLSLKQYMESIT